MHRLVGGDRTRVSADALSGLDRLLTAAVPDAPLGVFNVALEEWNTLANPPPAPCPATSSASSEATSRGTRGYCETTGT